MKRGVDIAAHNSLNKSVYDVYGQRVQISYNSINSSNRCSHLFHRDKLMHVAMIEDAYKREVKWRRRKN